MTEQVEIPYELDPLGLFALSRGATTVRETIANYLSNVMPDFIDMARQQWNAPDYMLPYPIAYDAYDPADFQVTGPVIGAYISSDNGWRRTDYDAAMGQEYSEVRYDVRLFAVVPTPRYPNGALVQPEYASTAKVRDDIITVMRAAILTDLTLGNSDATIEEGDLTTQYYDIIAMGDNRADFVVGGSLEIALQMRETIYRTTLGTVEEVEAEVGQLEPPAWEIVQGYVPEG